MCAKRYKLADSYALFLCINHVCMRIQLLSDLHLESHPHFQPLSAPGADVLVLAGDIGSYQAGSGLTDCDFGLARFSPLTGWPTPVLFVPGNHEYDALDFDDTHARLRTTCNRLGITWLEREVVTLQRPRGDSKGQGAVRFVGTTLWSDFDALALLGNAKDKLTEQLRLRGKAQRAANFYLKKAATTRNGLPWLADEMREHALLCHQWLHAAVTTNPPDDKTTTVVVTHFAPSLRSADPRYGLTPSTAGFCNALDSYLDHADFWLHGHLHCPSDYLHQGASRVCRVLANPLGYARKNEQAKFSPQFCIDV
jgi:Icc-related predicted phosphoesterase